jgi:hypothetical protein
MASTYRYHDMGTPTLTTKFTYSVWVKRSGLGAIGTIASMWKDGNNHVVLRFNSNDSIAFYDYSSSSISGELVTNALYRDTSAWYHIVAQFDSTQATAGDRMKLYVNGERITSFTGTEAYPSQNFTPTADASGTDNYLGARGDGANYDGLMSHAHFTDGYAYDASAFGSTDSTTGEWKINTSPSVTYGNNGWFMFKDDASLTDRSGNSNNFTNQSGTLTQTEDCPSNVFATINGLFQPDPSNGTFSTTNGGLSFTTNFTSQSIMGVTTIGATSGKYYAEFKLTGESGSGEAFAGIGYDIYDQATSSMNADSSFMWNVCSNGVSKQGGSEQPSGNWSNLYTTNDIISIAMDLDNNKVYFAKNGQYADGSGNWDEAFTGSPAYATITADKTYFFCAGDKSTSTNASWTCNFGNGYFGTTAISSEGTNASGIGKFEYDVPTGYTALSTKGLNL